MSSAPPTSEIQPDPQVVGELLVIDASELCAETNALSGPWPGINLRVSSSGPSYA